MSWIKTLRQICILFFVTLGLLSFVYGGLQLLGSARTYSRLDHDVLKKINNIIHLIDSRGFLSLEKQGALLLPTEISELQFLNIEPNLEPEASQNSIQPLQKVHWQDTLKNANFKDTDCLFVNIQKEDLSDDEISSLLSSTDKLGCIFIEAKNPMAALRLKREKPRWFYGTNETELQKSIFLSSLGLEKLASLSGDFIVLKEPLAKLPLNLQHELERRELVIFIANKLVEN
jgi:hypothetical protein